MKTLTPLLIISLALNGVLAVVASSRIIHASSVRRIDVSPTASPEKDSKFSQAAENTTPAKRNSLWTASAGKDIDGLIARLRAAGISDRELSAVLLATLSNANEALFAQTSENRPYWAASRDWNDLKGMGDIFARYREQLSQFAKYLYTPDMFAASESLIEDARQQFGDFPVETLRRLTLLQSDAQQKGLTFSIANLSPRKPGEPQFGNAQDAQYTRLRNESEAAIKAVLSPEQYEYYELRNSTLAQSLRWTLEAFRPTEAEYKTIFAVEKSFSDDADRNSAPNPSERSKVNAEIAAALGPERAADYAELQKSGSQLPRLMARLNLPLSTISSVNSVRDQTTASAKAIRENRQLSPAERSARLATLASDAERSLTSTLGAEGFEAYADSRGEWLNSIRQAPALKP